MEVVINTCFGGFGLSPEAERFLAKLQGKKVFFYYQSKYGYNNNGICEYRKTNTPDKDFLTFTLIKDLGDVTNELPNGKDIWLDSHNIKRNDKNLITVIRMLGEKANGKHASLKIIHIPDNIEWEIAEYDGMESIEEKHRSWS